MKGIFKKYSCDYHNQSSQIRVLLPDKTLLWHADFIRLFMINYDRIFKKV